MQLIAKTYWAGAPMNMRRYPADYALESLILAVLTGGIGGTIVGAIVRRASGRDKVKPAKEKEEETKKDSSE